MVSRSSNNVARSPKLGTRCILTISWPPKRNFGPGLLKDARPCATSTGVRQSASLRNHTGACLSATLSLPADFNWVGPAACERCQKLQSVDLFSTDVVELLGSTFAHCSQLQQLSLPHSLRIIEQEAFLLWISLQEVSIPPSLLYIARRAFAGCMKLRAFRRQGKSKTWRGTYAHRNVFDKCGQLTQPIWLRFLPPTAEDQWGEDFLAPTPQIHAC